MHTKDFNVAIVGGGICGVTLAIALLREGIQVDLYESAHQFGEIGAGIGLGNNSLKTLERLGVLGTILSHTGQQLVNSAWKYFEAEKLSTLYQLDSDSGMGQQLPMHRQASSCIAHELIRNLLPSAHRYLYIDALAPLLPTNVTHFKKRCLGVSQIPGEPKYTVHFEDGSQVKADVVVGADGIKSSIRQSVMEDIQKGDTVSGDARKYRGNLSFSGVRTYRGLIPMEILKNAGLKMDIDPCAFNLYLGKDKYMVAYVLGGKTLNIALSIADNDATRAIKPPLTTPWVLESIPNEEVMKQFSDWNEDLQTIIKHMGNPNMWAIHHLSPPLQHYARDGVVLVGDAAHAPTPFLGAGVSQGLDDVAVLRDLLTHPETTRSNVQRVLQEYDQIRPARGANVCDKSYAAGKLYMSCPDITSEGIKKVILAEMEKLYNHDLDVDIEVAIQALKAEGVFTNV